MVAISGASVEVLDQQGDFGTVWHYLFHQGFSLSLPTEEGCDVRLLSCSRRYRQDAWRAEVTAECESAHAVGGLLICSQLKAKQFFLAALLPLPGFTVPGIMQLVFPYNCDAIARLLFCSSSAVMPFPLAHQLVTSFSSVHGLTPSSFWQPYETKTSKQQAPSHAS